MPLPDNLERLKEVSIDTLDLSQSTQALLKWYGYTSILDCIAFFCVMSQVIDVSRRWPKHLRVLFAEVEPALITAGYWELVLNAEVWHFFREQYHPLNNRRVACWQGRDINLYEIPLEQLGIADVSPSVCEQLNSIGRCVDHFVSVLSYDSQQWLEIEKHKNYDGSAYEPHEFHKYVFGLVQPRLVELGYWRFVEEHVDDFDAEEDDWWDEVHLDDVLDGDLDSWEPFEGYDLPIHHVLLKWLSSPIRWIARFLKHRRKIKDE
jgi:hypothetical protein